LVAENRRNDVLPKTWKKRLGKVCNHSVGDAALGLQWHVIGMPMPASRRIPQGTA
jgi:hypothetical protein